MCGKYSPTQTHGWILVIKLSRLLLKGKRWAEPCTQSCGVNYPLYLFQAEFQ